MAQGQQQKNTTGARVKDGGKGAAGKAGPTAFDLKSATLGLLSLVLRSPDSAALAAGLAAKIGDTPDMFDQDPLLIDLSQLDRAPPSADRGQLDLDEAAATVDLAAVVTLLRGHRMQPVAVAGANESERAQAQSLGLALSSADDLSPTSAAREVEVVREVIREVEVVREVAGESVKTLIVDKPLRSGQQVYAKGGDLIVMALVNPGAEVIADGNIHVYAPLRGKAIAGAKGNTEARIFALSLEAELISIAGTYRTTENPLPDNVLRKPAQIRLDGDKLVMEPI